MGNMARVTNGTGAVEAPTLDEGAKAPVGTAGIDEAVQRFWMQREVTLPHDVGWWAQQAMIERDRNERRQNEATDANSRAGWAEECALVALRLLKREGRLKATTEDERLVIEWAEQNPRLNTPGANKRLASPHPDRDDYRREASANAQLVLGEEAA